MSSNHQLIQTWTGVIPAWRMKIFYQDRMQRPWKRQSAGLWKVWRQLSGFKDLQGFLGLLPVPTVKASPAMTHKAVLDSSFLLSITEEEQKIFTPFKLELLLYTNALDNRYKVTMNWLDSSTN